MAFKGDTFGAEEAKLTLFTNYFGTKAITEAVLPLMKEGGHIVNVSSRCEGKVGWDGVGWGGERSSPMSPLLRQRKQGQFGGVVVQVVTNGGCANGSGAEVNRKIKGVIKGVTEKRGGRESGGMGMREIGGKGDKDGGECGWERGWGWGTVRMGKGMAERSLSHAPRQ